MLYWRNYKNSYLILMLIISLSCFQNSIAQTPVSGTWTKAGLPYYVTADLVVPENSTLIIEEGVEIEFWGTWSLRIDGLLQAKGTKENMIIFHANGEAGQWKNIYFAESASPGCIMDYCIIKDGGYGDSTNIFICNNDTSVTISNCDISNSLGHGIFIIAYLKTDGGDSIAKKCNPRIFGNKIFDNMLSGIKINSYYINTSGDAHNNTNITEPLIEHNIIYKNKCNGINCLTYADGADFWGPDWYLTAQTNPFIQQNTIFKNDLHGIKCDIFLKGRFGNVTIEVKPLISTNIISDNGKYGLNAKNLVESSKVKFNCLWNNDSSNFKDINTNLGVLTHTNFNGDLCDVFFNIYSDPGFVDETNYDFHLTESSKCIDAGDTSFVRDPDGSYPEIGALYYEPYTNPLNDNNGITVKPNPFTPNSDGYNDYVEFKYPDMYSNKPNIKIFNLSGRKVAELKDFLGNEYRWYGNDIEDKDLNPGVYIYILEVEGKKLSKGTITLIR